MSGKITIAQGTKKRIYVAGFDTHIKRLENDVLIDDNENTDRAQGGMVEQLSTGEIYLGTWKGLYKYIDNKWSLIFSSSDISNHSWALLEHKDGTVWVTTGNKIYSLENDKLVDNLGFDNIQPYIGISMIQLDNGDIYVSNNYLHKYENKKLVPVSNDPTNVDPDNASGWFYGMYPGVMLQAKDGTFYIGSEGGIYIFKNGWPELIQAAYCRGGSAVQADDGTIYFGVKDAMYKIIGDKVSYINSIDMSTGFLYKTSDGSIYQLTDKSLAKYVDGLPTIIISTNSFFDGFMSEVDIPTGTKTISKPFIPFATGPHAGKKVMSIDVPKFNSFQGLTTMLTGFGYPTTGWAPTIHGEKVLIEGVEQTITGVYMDANFIIVNTNLHSTNDSYVSAPTTSTNPYPIPHDNKIYRQARYDNATGQVEIAGMGGKLLTFRPKVYYELPADVATATIPEYGIEVDRSAFTQQDDHVNEISNYDIRYANNLASHGVKHATYHYSQGGSNSGSFWNTRPTFKVPHTIWDKGVDKVSMKMNMLQAFSGNGGTTTIKGEAEYNTYRPSRIPFANVTGDPNNSAFHNSGNFKTFYITLTKSSSYINVSMEVVGDPNNPNNRRDMLTKYVQTGNWHNGSAKGYIGMQYYKGYDTSGTVIGWGATGYSNSTHNYPLSSDFVFGLGGWSSDHGGEDGNITAPFDIEVYINDDIPIS